MWQILIRTERIGTHHAFAHPVSELYNHPNGWALLLSPEPVGWCWHHQLYSGVGADIVMESITFTPHLNERYSYNSYAEYNS